MKHRETFDALRARADIIQQKAELFDSLMCALVHGTGEYRQILTRCRKFYEAEARERIAKRREKNERC